MLKLIVLQVRDEEASGGHDDDMNAFATTDTPVSSGALDATKVGQQAVVPAFVPLVCCPTAILYHP